MIPQKLRQIWRVLSILILYRAILILSWLCCFFPFFWLHIRANSKYAR
ncbi:hypothetical protein ACVWZV_009240 [Bradyrhizobium sp. GM5.1]